MQDKIEKRNEANVLIAMAILIMNKTYPDLRFHQIGLMLGLIKENVDQFNDEPIDVLIEAKDKLFSHLEKCNYFDFEDFKKEYNKLINGNIYSR